MTSIWCRTIGPAAILLAALSPAGAQQGAPPAAAPQQQPQAQQNPACQRLETQLQTFDRSSGDAGRADQMRKLQDSEKAQQSEIDRQETAARRAGCESNSFFALFSGQPSTCGPLTNRIKQLKANLDNTRSDIERLQGDPAPERDSQRRAIVVALAQNNCGQQYAAQVAAAPPQQRSAGLFDTLFGGRQQQQGAPGDGGGPPGFPGFSNMFGVSGTYRTVCVRTCDGFYYPISYATTQSRFADDERACRQSCPASEVMLFAHRNPGEDMNQAVSISGQPYTALPNAFKYRQSFDGSCSCRKPGESWSQALKNIRESVEEGDIVVNEQRAKQLSLPRDAQGRPIAQPNARPDPKTAPTLRPAAPASADAAPEKSDPNRAVRAVGPTFIPAR